MINIELKFGQQWSTVNDHTEMENAEHDEDRTYYNHCTQSVTFDDEHIIFTSTDWKTRKEICTITLENNIDIVKQLKLLVIALETEHSLFNDQKPKLQEHG